MKATTKVSIVQNVLGQYDPKQNAVEIVVILTDVELLEESGVETADCSYI